MQHYYRDDDDEDLGSNHFAPGDHPLEGVPNFHDLSAPEGLKGKSRFAMILIPEKIWWIEIKFEVDSIYHNSSDGILSFQMYDIGCIRKMGE